MAMSVWPSVNVVETPVFSIAEYHGHVASKSSNMSACLETIASAAEKPYQTAAFDVYVLVLEGCVQLGVFLLVCAGFEQDGKFTHATADPSKLLDVLNHFYKQEPGDWVCLRMTVDGLEAAGVETVFEATAPVGDTPSIDMGDQLFPHIQGGIPPEAVIAEHSVARSEDGAFVCIVGVCNGATTTFRKKMFSLLSQVADFTKRTQAPALVFMAGVCVGTAFARRRA
ncbi:hypothetical protein CTAYLR_003909 [Chrysophaeum taylorii]|uniref:Uncharacterized protein n=1 Tax=Chrysophaeum taylorii TaxID=2483200 RepID=A0AAD7XGN5_9STRA|nr:hypothetical protein CTAYLR_003909 [Chrysophaeum taylorii]